MLTSQVVDTKVLEPADRFEFWHHLVASETAPAHISSPHLHNFQAFAQAIDLGGVTLTALRYPSLTTNRTPKLARQYEADVYQLALPATGRSIATQDRRETAVKPANFIFLDKALPLVAHHTMQGEALATCITVQIPHAAVRLSPNKVHRLIAGSIPSQQGMGALLAQFLQQVAWHPEQYQATDAVQLGNTALDLITATLAHELDLEHALPVEVQQEALRARIDAFIEQHLSAPQLTPRAVAAAHHISVRALYRLFEGEGASVAELIRARRLERCRRDLTNPLMGGQPIYAIAARWGFSDKAHFSRLFRATYGMSPQQYRQQDR